MYDLQEKISIEYLKECFNYDPIEGKLYWNNDRPLSHFKTKGAYLSWKSQWSGKEAGNLAKIKGHLVYRQVLVNKIRTTGSKVMYALYYGHYVEMVDHLDGNPLNNKIENLKASSAKENAKNLRLSKNNTSGIVGVNWYEHVGKWRAVGTETCGTKRKNISLGYHTSLFDAACARISWQNNNGYSLRHGT